MVAKIITLLLFTLAVSAAPGQTCLHKELSPAFNYTTSVQRFHPVDEAVDSCSITIVVSDKRGKKTPQTLHLKSWYMLSTDFNDCKAARSYVTGKNRKAEVLDNDYGDLVVADLNFDGREDFAVKRDSGGNGGPFYAFYIQDEKGRFVKSAFLSEQMEYFPSKIDKERRTLTTYVHAWVCGLSEHIYRYDAGAKTWKEARQRIIDTCK